MKAESAPSAEGVASASPLDPGKCFSVEAAADYLGIGKAGLDWMYRQREIPSIKRGTRKVFERKDLDAYKLKNKRGGQQ